MKTLAVKTNKNNVKYALVQEGDKFGVWTLCSNYCRHAKSGIAKTWRYVKRNMTFEDAKVLYTRRSK
jgi:hypothetical protein